jgi:hypothetical protein
MSIEHKKNIDSTNSFSKLSFKKHAQIEIRESIDTCIGIIKNILKFTSKFTPIKSIFDINQKQYLDTDSESSDNESENMEIISKMEIDEFIERIVNYLHIDNTLLVLSMMILDKVLANKFILTENNVHKMIFICFMETQKFYEDENFKNKDYALVCGVNVDELLLMEVSFMELINFNLFIKDEDYQNYYKNFIQLCKSFN